MLVSQVLYKHLPRQRKLPDELKEEAALLLDYECRKKSHSAKDD